MLIVAFFRPYGSGKSALAGALVKELRRRGFKVRLSWMRGTHTIASILAMFLSRFNPLRNPIDNPYHGITLPPKLRLP